MHRVNRLLISQIEESRLFLFDRRIRLFNYPVKERIDGYCDRGHERNLATISDSPCM